MTITTSQLDELERNARGEMAGDGCCVPVAPDVALALIARIRELERTVCQAADLLEAKSDGAARREWAKAIRRYVTNGGTP